MCFGTPGQRKEDPAEVIAEPGRAGKLGAEQNRSVLKEACIGRLRFSTGITDEGEAFTHQLIADTGYEIGIVKRDRYDWWLEKKKAIEKMTRRLRM